MSLDATYVRLSLARAAQMNARRPCTEAEKGNVSRFALRVSLRGRRHPTRCGGARSDLRTVPSIYLDLPTALRSLRIYKKINKVNKNKYSQATPSTDGA